MAVKIFVDQGHNPYGVNAGAEAFGVREQDITYLVGAYLVDILNADPRFDAIASRQTPDEILGYDNNSSLRERVDMANTWGADYFISIHTNANTNPAINGTECYVYSQNNPAFYLAEDIVSQIVRRVGTKDNGVYVRPSLYVLRRTQMPSVLVELAYLTNYEDFVLLPTMQYQFAYGIYNGILNFLGLPFL